MAGIQKNSGLRQFDFALAGGGSGVLTRMVCQPLDVLKIRLQLQVEPISRQSVSKYKSVWQTVNVVVREEGVRSLWKGHIPAQYLSIAYGMTQFWTYEQLAGITRSLNFSPGFVPALNFTCGAISGCVATVASFPFDVIRTRLVAQNERQRVYSGVSQAFRVIFKTEGVLTLYRGILPTFIQIAPHGGVQFMMYGITTQFYKFVTNTDQSTLISSLFAGSIAGLCAKTIVYPLDLAKKRMQIQGFEHGRTLFGKFFKCQGMVDCLMRIYSGEGVLGLYKGFSPSVMKAVCATALHFAFYEMLCEVLRTTKA